jgi:hypothetical protein
VTLVEIWEYGGWLNRKPLFRGSILNTVSFLLIFTSIDLLVGGETDIDFREDNKLKLWSAGFNYC